ncbi:MAG: hypothetical protein COA42_21265 [Alteromonadaceae bacterium]|nr:MAG: hypothetical protein COA42_21265 [Alteromonadaceae bacterium]
MKVLSKSLAIVGATVFCALPAYSATTTFDFLENDGVPGLYQQEREYEVDGLGVTISGWTTNESAGGTIGSALIGQDEVGQLTGRGLGVGRAPSFEVDNSQDKFDMLLFDFEDSPVALTSISLGAIRHDSDMTILSYQGDDFDSFSGSFAGSSWEDLLDMGWVANGDYADVSLDGTDINSQQARSRYWLVGAYNGNILGGSLSAGDDFVKVATITVETPLPAAFVLFASGLLLLSRSRRVAARGKKTV